MHNSTKGATILLIASVGWAFTGVSAAHAARQGRATMSIEGVQKQVEQHLKLFQQSREIAEIRKGADLTGSIEVHAVPDFRQRQSARETKLLLWLQILDTMDDAKDLQFDPADVPSAHVALPDTPMKPGWMIASPEGIADPEVRRQYDRAVAANAEKTKRYRFQKELRQLDKELSARAETYIASAYLRSPVSVSEMNASIATHIHNGQRADHLRSLVQPYASSAR